MTPTTTTTMIANGTGTGVRLRINPTVCSGHGLCAELLAEHIGLDEWGYDVRRGVGA